MQVRRWKVEAIALTSCPGFVLPIMIICMPYVCIVRVDGVFLYERKVSQNVLRFSSTCKVSFAYYCARECCACLGGRAKGLDIRRPGR